MINLMTPERSDLLPLICSECRNPFRRSLTCDWHAQKDAGAICFHCFVALMLDGRQCDRVIFRGSGCTTIRANSVKDLQLVGFSSHDRLWYGLTVGGDIVTFENGTVFYPMG